MAGLGLRCLAWAFWSCGEWGLLFVAVLGLRIVVARRLWGQRLQCLQHLGSVVVAHGLSCSTACGIFLGQGLNPCPQHWAFLSIVPPGQSLCWAFTLDLSQKAEKRLCRAFDVSSRSSFCIWICVNCIFPAFCKEMQEM